MNDAAGTITVSTTFLSFSVLIIIFSIGVAWGTMNSRVNTIDRKVDEKLNKELFNEFRQNIEGLLKSIKTDMYDIRRSMHTLIGHHELANEEAGRDKELI